MSLPEYPTPWQRKTIWTALASLAVVTIGAILVGFIWLITSVLGFLQPILVPFATAGVLAYLLNPVVSMITNWGTSRPRAVFSVFAIVTILFAGMLVWILPALSAQSINLARKVPGYTLQVRERMANLSNFLHDRFGLELIPSTNVPKTAEGPISALPSPTPAPTPAPEPMPVPEDEEVETSAAAVTKASTGTTPSVAATTGTADIPPPAPNEAPADPIFDLQQYVSGDWLQNALRQMFINLGNTIRASLGGFLGVIGFLLSLVIVPIYLYYFLIEAPSIEKEWHHYVPLRASAFKDEVVATLQEINGYLIAFFRGQLVVSMINGAVTGLGLVVAGLEFGLLIGLVLCFLGIIPYLGITFCWIVAVIIASVQGGSWCVVGQDWWVFPLLISAIFIVVHHVDGLFVTPHIVGESVGLHPLTVIFSVFAWSVVLGGLLGAILAVPLTATLKVILRRYVWERRFRPAEAIRPAGSETADVVEEPFAPGLGVSSLSGAPVTATSLAPASSSSIAAPAGTAPAHSPSVS